MIEAENNELKERVKENKDNKDARLEVVELKQKIEDLETANESMDQIISEKEAVIMDCNVYIENMTGQLNQKTEELVEMNERVLNNSTMNTKDEEIASLQAEIGLLHDIKSRERALEEQVGSLEMENGEDCREAPDP